MISFMIGLTVGAMFGMIVMAAFAANGRERKSAESAGRRGMKIEQIISNLKNDLERSSLICPDEVMIELKETAEIMITALQKQIPKEPAERGAPRFKWYACPVCGEDIAPDSKYYNECGQALKWEAGESK